MRKTKPTKRDFKKTLGFLIGCALILAAPHSMYASFVLLHPNAIPGGYLRVMSLIVLLPYPVPVLIGLYVLFWGLVLVWKCQPSIKELDVKT